MTTPATLDAKVPPIRGCDNAELFVCFVFRLLRRRVRTVNSNDGRTALFLPSKSDSAGEEVQSRRCGPPGSEAVGQWLKLSRSRLCNIIHTSSSRRLNATLGSLAHTQQSVRTERSSDG